VDPELRGQWQREGRKQVPWGGNGGGMFGPLSCGALGLLSVAGSVWRVLCLAY
jgi:hypothetical protein